MARRQREFVVGLVALVGIGALLFLTIRIRGTSLLEGSYKVLVRFPQVAGSLTRGASVLVYGVKVGEVTDIRIAPDAAHPANPVEVELRIRNAVTLYQNAEIVIKESAIIGETTIVVGPGSPNAPPLKDGDTVLGADPGDVFEEIRARAPEIVFEIAESVRIVREFLEELNENRQLSEAISDLALIIDTVEESIVGGQGDLRTIVENLRAFTDQLDDSVALLNATMAGAREDIHGIRAEISEALAAIRTGSDARLEQAGTLLERADHAVALLESYAEENAPRWAAITAALASTSASADRILRRLEAGEGTLGLLATDPALYRELTATLAAANRWMGQISAWLSGARGPIESRTVLYDTTARMASPSASAP